MSTNALDRLTAQHDEDVRRIIADVIGANGTRQQVVDLLATRYDFTVTTRTVTNWMNNDDGLVEMLDAQQVARRAINPDAAADIPAPRNRAQDDANMFWLMETHPAFAAFVCQDSDRSKHDTGAPGYEFAGAAPVADDADDDPHSAEIVAILHSDDMEAAALAALGVDSLDEYLDQVEVPVTGAGRITD
jgi:hypothetical protein